MPILRCHRRTLPTRACSGQILLGATITPSVRFIMARYGAAKARVSEEYNTQMPRDLRNVFREAFDLPENDRATLAGLLIESLEGPPDAAVEEEWAMEAERRWQEIDRGEVQTISWEEVRAKLFRRGSNHNAPESADGGAEAPSGWRACSARP